MTTVLVRVDGVAPSREWPGNPGSRGVVCNLAQRVTRHRAPLRRGFLLARRKRKTRPEPGSSWRYVSCLTFPQATDPVLTSVQALRAIYLANDARLTAVSETTRVLDAYVTDEPARVNTWSASGSMGLVMSKFGPVYAGRRGHRP